MNIETLLAASVPKQFSIRLVIVHMLIILVPEPQFNTQQFYDSIPYHKP